jgi:single-stranded-DNA-specific exonuclease
VGFKLLQGLCEKTHMDTTYLYEFLDLVAVSIASDIVPITGENRILEFYGLEKLNRAPRPGLEMLMEVAGLAPPLNVHNVVFGIGPRINAAGRIEHAKAAVNLLLAKSQEEAMAYANNLNRRNAERKGFDTKITQEAIAMIEEDEQLKSAKTTVLFKNDWHKGVIGIVASRCIEKYYRPTIILTESNNKATGSARSVVGFDVYEAIQECADLLEQFGGHTYAAGLTLSIDKVPAFQQKFETVVASRIAEDLLIPQIDIDQPVQLTDITPKFYNILKQMAPFGPQNMQPVFMADNLTVEGSVQILKEEHLKFNVRQAAHQPVFPAIAFGMVEKLGYINQGQTFQMVFTIEENHFNGHTSLQLMVKDIKPM